MLSRGPFSPKEPYLSCGAVVRPSIPALMERTSSRQSTEQAPSGPGTSGPEIASPETSSRHSHTHLFGYSHTGSVLLT